MSYNRQIQVSCNDELEKYSVMPSSSGDIASGTINLFYKSGIIAEVPYDTKGGPDGLTMVIDAGLGDWVYGKGDGNYCEILVTEKILTNAKNHFNGDNRAKAVRGKMTIETV